MIVLSTGGARCCGSSSSSSLPQHHLIIVVKPPLCGSEDEEESDILTAHGVTVDEIEPAVLALARRQGPDGLRRAARLAATNRALRQHGFAQLLLLSAAEAAVPAAAAAATMGDTMRMVSSVEAEEQRALCPDELAGMAAVGLTEEEYRAIKGVDGIVLGLHLDVRARQRLKSICRLQLQGPEAMERIRRYARTRLGGAVVAKNNHKKKAAGGASGQSRGGGSGQSRSSSAKKRKRTAPAIGPKKRGRPAAPCHPI